MRRRAALCAAAVLTASLVYAQAGKETPAVKEGPKAVVLRGYVVDAMCAQGMLKKGNVMERAAKHTKECALEESCAPNGYGVFSDGKWYKFDNGGDTQAKSLIEKGSRTKALMFEVSGKLSGTTLAVQSLKETDAGKETAPKQDSRHHPMH